jgi:hypothetical protein
LRHPRTARASSRRSSIRILAISLMTMGCIAITFPVTDMSEYGGDEVTSQVEFIGFLP